MFKNSNTANGVAAWWKDNHGEYKQIKKPKRGYVTDADVDESKRLKQEMAENAQRWEAYTTNLHQARLSKAKLIHSQERNRVSAYALKEKERLEIASANTNISQIRKLTNAELKAKKTSELCDSYRSLLLGGS